ncbi:MAG: metal-dependent transcriptional regulator [Peptococcaceae bacterium]|nr:metal-dependent transcriptional regulator [Peptococcaceae bacterium]
MSNLQQLSPALEDYLETILELSEQEKVVRVTDIAARLNIAKASVAQALSNLKKLKLITQDRYGPVWLTAKGRAYAAGVRRRHETLVYFLVNVLGVDPAIAEKDACEMEHVVSSQTMDRLVAFLESKRYIPIGEANVQETEKSPKRLDELAVGKRAKVVSVNATGAFRRRLLEIGITPGTEIVIEGVAPLGDPVEVNVKGYHLSLRKSEAACILVQPT